MILYNELWEFLEKHSFPLLSNVVNDLTCMICQRLLIDSWEGPCGCLYCKKCIDEYLTKGYQTCPSGNEECLMNGKDYQFSIRRNNSTNKRISQLEVKCPSNNCEYKCTLHEMCDHFRICGTRLDSFPKPQSVILRETCSSLLNALCNHILINRKWIKRTTKSINSCCPGDIALSLVDVNSDQVDVNAFTNVNIFQLGQIISEEKFKLTLEGLKTVKFKSDDIVSRIYESADRFLNRFLEENEKSNEKVEEENDELEISIEIINEYQKYEETPEEKADRYRETIKRLTRENEFAILLRLEKEKQDREIHELKMDKENILTEKSKLINEIEKQRKKLAKSNQENEKLKKEIKELQQTEKGWLKKWIPMTPIKDMGNKLRESVVEKTVGLFVCHFKKISLIDTSEGSNKFYFTNRFIDVWIRLWPRGCKSTNYHHRDTKRLCLDFLIDDGIIRYEEKSRRHPRTYEVKIVLKSNSPNNDKSVSICQRFEFDGIRSYTNIFTPSQFHFLKSEITENQIIGNDDSLLVQCQIDLANDLVNSIK